MTNIDEATKLELAREVAIILAKKQHLSFASDFHAFADGRHLTLAGVNFENFSKGPNTKRSDGDVVAHAVVMALAGATNTGDIDDWFPDKGEVRVKSMDYLPEMRRRLIEKEHLLLGTVDVTILCGEQPRMKKRVTEMQRNIAEGLGIDIDQVHVKVSSMDGRDEIASLEGIEARVLISVWKGLYT
jgi:2-C-methyl-D-erythritol 2,4-cyclodiphosphate synthase